MELANHVESCCVEDVSVLLSMCCASTSHKFLIGSGASAETRVPKYLIFAFSRCNLKM